MMKTTQMTVISLTDLAEELDWSTDSLRSILMEEDNENRQNFIVFDPSKLNTDTLSYVEKRIFDYITKNFGGDPVIIKNSIVYKVTLVKKEVVYVEANSMDEAVEKAYDVVDNDESFFFPLDPVDDYECSIADSAEYADATVY
jgi:hypothetical protein